MSVPNLYRIESEDTKSIPRDTLQRLGEALGVDFDAIRHYTYQGYLPTVKQPITDRAVNGNGIPDTARLWKISLTTDLEELKPRTSIRPSE